MRVTSPQTRLAQLRGSDAKGRLSRLSGRAPLSSLTAIDFYAAERALHRQRRLAARTAVALGTSLAVLLTAAVLSPGRLGWAVLFLAPYPVLLVLAALHVRRAERIEAEHGHRPPREEAFHEGLPLDRAARDGLTLGGPIQDNSTQDDSPRGNANRESPKRGGAIHGSMVPERATPDGTAYGSGGPR